MRRHYIKIGPWDYLARVTASWAGGMLLGWLLWGPK